LLFVEDKCRFLWSRSLHFSLVRPLFRQSLVSIQLFDSCFCFFNNELFGLFDANEDPLNVQSIESSLSLSNDLFDMFVPVDDVEFSFKSFRNGLSGVSGLDMDSNDLLPLFLFALLFV